MKSRVPTQGDRANFLEKQLSSTVWNSDIINWKCVPFNQMESGQDVVWCHPYMSKNLGRIREWYMADLGRVNLWTRKKLKNYLITQYNCCDLKPKDNIVAFSNRQKENSCCDFWGCCSCTQYTQWWRDKQHLQPNGRIGSNTTKTYYFWIWEWASYNNQRQDFLFRLQNVERLLLS